MKKKKILAILMMIFMMISYANFVNASSFKFTSEAQKEIFKPGEEILVSLDISGIQAGTEGINVVEMSLEYDESIFDSMEFVKANEWDSYYNNNKDNEKFGKLLYTNISAGITEAQSIGNIKFKLKDTLEDMETEIKLISVTSNDGKELIPEGDRIIKIKIVNDRETPEEPTKPEEPKKEEPVKQEEPKKEEPEQVIPQTGQTRAIYIFVSIIIVCALIALLLIMMFSKVSNNGGKNNQ